MSPEARAAEHALVERAQRDPEAFAELYEAHRWPVWRFMCSRTNGPMVAEDLTADVFLKAFRALPAWRPREHATFLAWLMQIAVNRLADHYRVRRQDAGPYDALWALEVRLTDGVDVTEVAEHRELMAAVWAAVAAITPQQRRALELRYRDDLTNAQAGLVMGKSEGAVKLLVLRGLASVRARLEGRLEDAA